LLPHKDTLLARRIRHYDENNWWQWGRGYPETDAPRIYVNQKTRQAAPFFLHDCPHFDGAVLALFPHRRAVDLPQLTAALNAVDWRELGFVCDGRFLFTQRSLENSPLPDPVAALFGGAV
ncbi:MAG TPA: class I SAM-dependent methyltransferase, partial [Rhodocyclaceae bacterium]|nr:class I SAM-dependent methyltransferase [Rhodocyclaceae bacterium]